MVSLVGRQQLVEAHPQPEGYTEEVVARLDDVDLRTGTVRRSIRLRCRHDTPVWHRKAVPGVDHTVEGEVVELQQIIELHPEADSDPREVVAGDDDV